MSKENMLRAMVATKQLEIDKLKRLFKDKEDDGTITFGDRTMIPKSWVIKITEI